MANKIKVTEKQLKMLQELDSNKVMYITKEQFRLLESEYRKLPQSKKPKVKVTKNFKKYGKGLEGVKYESEDNLMGHPIGGSGGKEYNPQSDKQHKKTFKSFNEANVREGGLDPQFMWSILQFVKFIYSNPTPDSIKGHFQRMGMNGLDILRFLIAQGLIITGMQDNEKVYRIAKKADPAEMIKKVGKAIKSYMKKK